jgi:uncharacterized protein
MRATLPIRVLLALGVTAATATACDHDPEKVGEHPRQVTVVGSGHVQGVPDTLTADVGIEFNAPEATTAINFTNQRQQTLIGALTGAGVDRKDIATTRVELQPQYGPDNAITGYHAENSIQITIHPPERASQVLATVVTTGGNASRINSVRYSIADDSQLVRDARARAFDDAKAHAEQYAQLAGLRLGSMLSISESAQGPSPGPILRAPMASNVPLEPGQQTVSFSVTAVWELR